MHGPLNVKLTELYDYKRQRYGKTMKKLTRTILMLPNIVPGAQF